MGVYVSKRVGKGVRVGTRVPTGWMGNLVIWGIGILALIYFAPVILKVLVTAVVWAIYIGIAALAIFASWGIFRLFRWSMNKKKESDNG